MIKLTVLVMTALLMLPDGAYAREPGFESAKWIGFQEEMRDQHYAVRTIQREVDKNPVPIQVYPSVLMRKTFSVSKPVKSAVASVCGLGVHELYLNDEKIGDHVLSPAISTYDKRAFYVVHDVTAQLKRGRNIVGIWLGNGFYGQNFGFGQGLQYGRPLAKMVLVISYEDGSSESVVSDPSWMATQSPVVFDNIYGGETYDARLAEKLRGWSAPEFDSADWRPVLLQTALTENLVEEELEPMRKIRPVKPVAVLPAENGEWIINMGQNMTGWLHIQVNEPRDTVVEMRFAEVLMPGRKALDTASTGVLATGCEQRDIYICRGGGESWEPRFTYHGFQYVQIKGVSKKPELKDFTGWLVRSDLRRIGTFECSDPLINKFYNVSLWTIEDNLQGLLSDCPHRERCAWLGDMHATAETICMNYAAQGLWRKLINDFKTVLGTEGTVPQHYPAGQCPEKDPRAPSNIAVGRRLCGQARPDWGMAVVLVPWFDLLFYGESEPAAKAWPMMTGYMDFLQEKEVQDYLVKDGYAYGDWCPPGTNAKMDTSPQLTATALYFRSLQAMARMSELFGKTVEQKKYAMQAERVKAAFNQKFFDKEKNHYGSQTSTAVALNCGLVADGSVAEVSAGLNRLIMEDAKGHYTTGMLGHRHLYTPLNDNGFAETTKHLWSITDYPSLGFMTEKHGLSVWPEVVEDWPAGERYSSNSFNHPMQSGFAVTFHESICGIRPDPEYPGFKRFILKPCFLPGLEWAKADYSSVQGVIKSSWKREGGKVLWKITVPEGTQAKVFVPGEKKPREVGSGEHEFVVERL